MKTVRHLLLFFGWLFLLVGIVGIFVPLLPTTPFLLLAAYCFARSSKRLHDWLLEHPQLGPPLRDWERAHVIRRGPKMLATAMIFVSAVLMWLSPAPRWAQIAGSAVFISVLTFIWTRKES